MIGILVLVIIALVKGGPLIMRFYGFNDAGTEVELPISDEVLDLTVEGLVDWASILVAHAISDLYLNPALPLGVGGGSLTGELSEAWALVNVALRDAAKMAVNA